MVRNKRGIDKERLICTCSKTRPKPFFKRPIWELACYLRAFDSHYFPPHLSPVPRGLSWDKGKVAVVAEAVPVGASSHPLQFPLPQGIPKLTLGSGKVVVVAEASIQGLGRASFSCWGCTLSGRGKVPQASPLFSLCIICS